jgi:hypothetical protein
MKQKYVYKETGRPVKMYKALVTKEERVQMMMGKPVVFRRNDIILKPEREHCEWYRFFAIRYWGIFMKVEHVLNHLVNWLLLHRLTDCCTCRMKNTNYGS